MNIAQWFDDSLGREGDYTALVVGDEPYSNQSLHDDASRLAGALIELGLAPGDRVLLLLPSGHPVVVACPAVWRAGGVVVVGYHGATAAEIERIAAHCAAKVIITGPGVQLPAAGVRGAITISTATETPVGSLSFGQLLAGATPLERPVPRSESDLAQLSYTSGTTGAAKAVAYTHGGLGAYLAHIHGQWQAGGRVRDVVLLPLPPTAFGAIPMTKRPASHDTLVVVDGSDPGAVFDALERHRVTYVAAVPTLVEKWLAAGPPPDASRDLRTIVLTGAHVPHALLDRIEAAFGVVPVVTYGMTEAGGGIAWSHGRLTPGCVGDILEGVEVRVLDPNGDPLPAGREGEVVIRTPWMAAGYYRDAEASAEVFVDGWVRTGDRGSVSEGALYLTGRSKDLIIQGGVNVSPAEIEPLITSLPGVLECAVVGLANAALGEIVVACVVKAQGAELSERDILAHCRTHLDSRKVPARIVWVESIPRTATGKVKRSELATAILARRTTPSAFAEAVARAPSSARADLVSELVTRLVGELLEGKGVIDPDRPLGDLGLDSVGAVRLAHSLGDITGVAVPATLAFTHPTLSSLAQRLLVLMSEAEGRVPDAAAVAVTRPSQAPVAIVGIGCRIPGDIDSPEALWDLLRTGGDVTGRSPGERWPDAGHGARGAFLSAIDTFDAEFFQLGAHAQLIDPQHRLVLEVVWEALERGGMPTRDLGDAEVGLFLGISGSSYSSPDGLGVAASMAAGRVCHFFDLRGPTLSVDTSCSSALVALHEAVRSLRAGECQVAIAGGVHVMSSPEAFAGLAELGVLAPDGRCRPFDDGAHGFSRSEGCIMLVLKTLDAARRDGDAIEAVIRGTAIGSDGRSSSLTAPNPSAQVAVIRRALADAGVDAEAVQYVEAHGTGTRLGDPIEVEALANVFAGRQGAPVRIGSVKSNLGHLEAAAGLAGVLKVALAAKHTQLPASLHVDRPNQLIPWHSVPIQIQTETGAWPTPAKPRLAGVSSFGMSGTNAHVIVEAAPEGELPPVPASAPSGPLLLPLSARTATALARLAERTADVLERGGLDAAAVGHTAARRRNHLEHRLVVLGRETSDWVRGLREAAQRRTHATPSRLARAGLVMVFGGQGSQWPGMAGELMTTEPVFRDAIHACAQLIDPQVSWSVVEELERVGEDSRVDQTEIAQPLLFSVQVALCALWESWGVRPAAVIGHSLGEIAAAHVSGALSLDQATRLVVLRGRIMQSATGKGSMLAARMSATEAESLCAQIAQLEIAADNGPQSVTLAGPHAAVTAAGQWLDQRGIRHKALLVRYAFHTEQVAESARAITEALREWTPAVPQVPFWSTVTAAESPTLDASYWGRQIRQRVRLRETAATLFDRGHRVFLEIGAHPVLLDDLDGTFAGTGHPTCLVPSLRRREPAAATIRQSLGELHCAGVSVDWSALYPGARPPVPLPTYPWERRRYWFEAPSRAERGRVSPLLAAHVPLLDEEHAHVFTLRGGDGSDSPGVKAATWLAAAAEGFAHAEGETRVVLDSIDLAPHSQHAEARDTQLRLRPEGEAIGFRILSPGPVEHARGRARRADEPAPLPVAVSAVAERCQDELWFGEIYPPGLRAAIPRTGEWRSLARVRRGTAELLAELARAAPSAMSRVQPSPVVLDACVQCLALLGGVARMHGAFPTHIESVVSFDRGDSPPAWVHAHETADGKAEALVLDTDGVVLARVRGADFRELAVVSDHTHHEVAAGSIPPESRPSLDEVVRSIIAELIHVGAGEMAGDAPLDDLGFDSLLMLTLRRRLSNELDAVIGADLVGPELRVDEIGERLAAHLGEPRGSTLRLRTLSSAEGPPLFLVHPVGGTTDCYRPLAGHWPGPVHAIEAPRDGDELWTMDDIADRYLSLLDEAAPRSPWVLAGWSFGACVAQVMATRLEDRLGAPSLLTLIDPPPVPDGSHLSGARAVRMFSRDLVAVRGGLSLDEDAVTKLIETAMHGDPRDYDQHLVTGMVERGLIPTSSAIDVREALATFRRHLLALASMPLRPYHGPTLLVRASRSPASDWSRWTNGREDQLEADHYSIVREPTVSELAVRMRDALFDE